MPTLYVKKGSNTYSITLYEKKPTNPALTIKYGGKTYYAGLSSNLSHANATPVRVSMGGVTYVLLAKTENPWIEAFNKNGFWLEPVGSASTPYEVLRLPYKINGGVPNAHFNLKTTSGFIYTNLTFDASGSTQFDTVGGFRSHMSNNTVNCWVQYI